MNEKKRRKLRKFVIFRPAQDLSRMFAGQSSTHETNSLHWPLTYAESKVLCNYETDQAELSKETVTRIIHQDSTLSCPSRDCLWSSLQDAQADCFKFNSWRQIFNLTYTSHISVLRLAPWALTVPFVSPDYLMSKTKKSNAMITFLFY